MFGWFGTNPEDQDERPEQPVQQPEQPVQPATPAQRGYTRSGRWSAQAREEALAAAETEKAARSSKKLERQRLKALQEVRQPLTPHTDPESNTPPVNQGGNPRNFDLEAEIEPDPGNMVNYDQENANDGENAQKCCTQSNWNVIQRKLKCGSIFWRTKWHSWRYIAS